MRGNLETRLAALEAQASPALAGPAIEYRYGTDQSEVDRLCAEAVAAWEARFQRKLPDAAVITHIIIRGVKPIRGSASDALQ